MDSVSAAHPARPSVTACNAQSTHVYECILRSKFSAHGGGRILLKINMEYRFGELCGVWALATLPASPSRFEIARGLRQPGRLRVISRRAAILSSSGGCVLNKDAQTEPPPNIGFTMQRAAVVSGMLLGMR